MPQFSTPRGTQDVLPDDWPFWDYVHAHAQSVAAEYGYRRIETPTFGETSLFSRSSGEGSDIVDKEMYTFEDRGGDSLTLRPEGTAPVMRAYLQHGMHLLPQPVKLFYLERMYRYDRPQRGRLREHHQFGCEAIGSDDAYVDVEMIDLLNTFHRRLGLNQLSLNLNTIGDRECRPQYVRHLVDYLRAEKQNLDPLDRDRLERNPLRVLDSKERVSQDTIEKAPHMVDFLCRQCQAHWNKVQRGLNALGISFTINHRLVRGLDYYTRTVFEFLPAREGSQSTVDAGGRYDALSEAIGGPSVPGIGFGCGLERLILELRAMDIRIPTTAGPVVYVAHLGDAAEDAALQMAAELRHAGTTTIMGFGGRSIKSQLKQANTVNARFAAILGDDELARRTVTLRSLRDHTQMEVPIASITEQIPR